MKFRLLFLAIIGAALTLAQSPEELQAFRLEYRLNFDQQGAPVLGAELAEAVLAGSREVRQQVLLDAPAKRLTVRTFTVVGGAPATTPLRELQTTEIENYRVDVRRIAVGERSFTFEGIVASGPRVFLAPVIAGDTWSMRTSWYSPAAPVFYEVLLGFALQTAYIAGADGAFEFSRVPNRSPVPVIAPAPQTLFQPDLRLDASASSDPDGETLDYRWTVVRGSVSFTGADTATPRIQFHSGPGQYELLVTVTDSRGASAQASVSTGYYGR